MLVPRPRTVLAVALALASTLVLALPGCDSSDEVSLEGCPSTVPKMNDPCDVDHICGDYDKDGACPQRATCKNGRWTTSYLPSGTCDFENACPDQEPEHPETGACPSPMQAMPALDVCRYPRKGCFAYLSCEYSRYGDDRWHPSYHLGGDSCCPEQQPAVGDACSEENVLCNWTFGKASTEMICTSGAWAMRTAP